MHTQVAVLGGGPGGYAAAFLAADDGLEVTLIEKDERLGGTCLLRGCIPSKALLHVAKVMHEADGLAEEWGVAYTRPQVNLDVMRGRKDKVIATLAQGLGQLAKRRKVKVVRATGRFRDSQTIELDGDHDSIPEDRVVTFDHAIIATGSSPAMPSAFDIGSERVYDSTGALALREIPKTMLVIGGGYIGLEMATVYAQLGAKVTVVELLDGLLMGADRDLVRPLEKRLRKLFDDRIYLNTKVGSLSETATGVQVALEGPGEFGTHSFDHVLVSVGRRPNTQNLGLENTAAKLDNRGFVLCDDQLRTADARIFAIGDVAGEPMLAHKATHEGRTAVEAILGRPVVFDKLAMPAVVFTDPEIAWVGLTETEAKRQDVVHEVAVYPWAASGRAQAIRRTEGLTKWLISPETNRVLGCGIVGPGAGDLIAEAALAIEMGCEVDDITATVHAHPTMSETLMNAGEVFLGTATEIYKPRRKK